MRVGVRLPLKVKTVILLAFLPTPYWNVGKLRYLDFTPMLFLVDAGGTTTAAYNTLIRMLRI